MCVKSTGKSVGAKKLLLRCDYSAAFLVSSAGVRTPFKRYQKGHGLRESGELVYGVFIIGLRCKVKIRDGPIR